MANTGFYVNGVDMAANWPDKSYVMDRYPELADTLKQAGIWGWGYNANGTLGDNSATDKSSPVQTVAGGTNWKFLSSGNYCTGAIKSDGTLWMWGTNSYGVLGDNTRTIRSSPVQTAAAGTTWKQVSSGKRQVGAIKTDGTLWTWGRNAEGQLGTNTQTHQSSPVQTVSGGTSWKFVASGGYSMSAIKTDGTLWLWGSNDNGQLAVNDATKRSSPTQIVGGGSWKTVSINQTHMAAIKTDGSLWTCGWNGYGQLGTNTTTGYSSPVQTISSGTNWKLVSCGKYFTSAIKTDGTLWLWGDNTTAQLGDNTTTNRSSPVQTIAAGTNWKVVYASVKNAGGIKTDGTLWNWGFNTYGELGNNATAQLGSPVQTVAGGTNWKLVSGGLYYSVALRDDSSDPI